MVSFREINGAMLQPRLRRLQEMQGEIYRQLQLLVPDAAAHHDFFCSSVSGSPTLRMDILERHPYTHFLRLTYLFDEGGKPELAPDAHIRLYQDARLAEVTAFNHDQGCRRSAHPWYPHRQLFQRAWRQNLALDKWLGYLLQQGHSFETMEPASDCIHGKLAVPVPVPVG
jgi:uncharacterized protein YqiB (DUF1249 family)